MIKRINTENEVEVHKTYWSNLAKEGLAMEVEKESQAVKEPAKKKQMTKKGAKVNKTQTKNKCGHCEKLVGQKIALQCENCENLNLVECLKDLEAGRIQDFKVGKDKFYCTKCVSSINIDTLAIESVPMDTPPNTLEEVSDELLLESDETSREETDDMRIKIENLEFEVRSLASKNKLLVETSEEIKRRKCDVEIELENSKTHVEQLRPEFDEYKKNATIEKDDEVIEEIKRKKLEVETELETSKTQFQVLY